MCNTILWICTPYQIHHYHHQADFVHCLMKSSSCSFHSLFLLAILAQVVVFVYVWVSSLNLLFCLPLLLSPFLSCHLVSLLVHLLSSLRDKCPAHLQCIPWIFSLIFSNCIQINPEPLFPLSVMQFLRSPPWRGCCGWHSRRGSITVPSACTHRANHRVPWLQPTHLYPRLGLAETR